MHELVSNFFPEKTSWLPFPSPKYLETTIPLFISYPFVLEETCFVSGRGWSAGTDVVLGLEPCSEAWEQLEVQFPISSFSCRSLLT